MFDFVALFCECNRTTKESLRGISFKRWPKWVLLFKTWEGRDIIGLQNMIVDRKNDKFKKSKIYFVTFFIIVLINVLVWYCCKVGLGHGRGWHGEEPPNTIAYTSCRPLLCPCYWLRRTLCPSITGEHTASTSNRSIERTCAAVKTLYT